MKTQEPKLPENRFIDPANVATHFEKHEKLKVEVITGDGWADLHFSRKDGDAHVATIKLGDKVDSQMRFKGTRRILEVK